jgi:hypothetical protein
MADSTATKAYDGPKGKSSHQISLQKETIMKIALALVACAVLSACGIATHVGDVLQIGPDAYSTSADDLNAPTAMKAAMNQVQQKCGSMGRDVLITGMKPTENGRVRYDVTFRCLPKGDPQLTRPLPN